MALELVYVTPPAVPGQTSGGDGTQARPFHSVGTAMSHAKRKGGGVVLVRGGHYVESILLENFGQAGEKMVVTAHGGGEVFIDSMRPEFLAPQTAEDHWYPVTPAPGSPGGPVGEYVWGRRYEAPDLAHRGAFLDEDVHTRLVSYDRREDLTAPGQVWPDKATKGNRVWRLHPNQQDFPDQYVPENRKDHRHFRPWVYMGPGIWFDPDNLADSPGLRDGGRRIHIRLAATNNDIPGWPDYDPATTDPNQVRLAISLEGAHAMLMRKVKNIRFRNLTLRFGNPDTIRLNSCANIAFDHCRIRSGSRAIFLATEEGTTNQDISLEHCVIDGGLPPWVFRSDRKDNYVFGGTDEQPLNLATATLDQLEQDHLAFGTSGVQVSGTKDCHRTVVHHCEIYNAHDNYIFGTGMKFHHNWVDNLNDDGIALTSQAETTDAEIFCNVVTQCLTALSFAPTKPVGPAHIYANLFDIREPTLGKRPTGEGTVDSLRQGHFFKDGKDEGEIYLFHNTCLVFDPGAKGDDLGDMNRAGFAYYSAIGTSEPRPAYNNIFVAAFSSAASSKPIAFLPPDGFGPTDGNTYLRIPAGTKDNFIVRRVVGPPPTPPTVTDDFSFPGLSEYREHYWPGGAATEYEHDGEVGDPVFKSFDTATGRSRRGDDLRLRFNPNSPAKGTAVAMPAELTDKYTAATGTLPADRGCYPLTGARLQVGVDGRQVYPWMRPGPRLDTHTDDLTQVAVDDE